MSEIQPFKAIRPAPEYVEKVVSPPYDVVNREEAAALCEGNSCSFMHVIRAEVDLPEVDDIHSDAVYRKGRANLEHLLEEGFMVREERDAVYIYQLEMAGRVQTGLAFGASVSEYSRNIIRKHELTRTDKELDRTEHIKALGANTGPVLLTYREHPELSAFVERLCRSEAPLYDFSFDGVVTHRLWVVSDEDAIRTVQNCFREIPNLYIADGHHRSAAASHVADFYSDDARYDSDFFLAVAFPDNQLRILAYNRAVKDLNGLSPAELLAAVEKVCERGDTPVGKAVEPTRTGEFSLFLEEQWHRFRFPAGMKNTGTPEERLDVALLQKHILAPILGIGEPRTDKRIDFIGGIRGIGELERRCTGGDMAVAFCLYPTAVEELIAIADAEKIMPPKSTWFEPKLGSGLLVRPLEIRPA